MDDKEKPTFDRWFGPEGSTRFHYFDNNLRSLCSRWMLWTDPATAGLDWGMALGNASGDCAECKRRVEKLKAVA